MACRVKSSERVFCLIPQKSIDSSIDSMFFRLQINKLKSCGDDINALLWKCERGSTWGKKICRMRFNVTLSMPRKECANIEASFQQIEPSNSRFRHKTYLYKTQQRSRIKATYRKTPSSLHRGLSSKSDHQRNSVVFMIRQNHFRLSIILMVFSGI